MKTTTKNYWPQIAIVFFIFWRITKRVWHGSLLKTPKTFVERKKKWYLLMLDI